MKKINKNISKGNLRSLEEVENKYVQIIILILSGISTFLIINLILSINYENNSNLKEIFLIPNLNSSRDNSDSNKTKSNENIFEANCENDCTLFSLVISLLILLFKTIQKKMGKKNAAYCSLISLSIIYLASSAICLVFHFFITGGISCGLFAFNFLIILILNLNWGFIFRCIGSKGENKNNNILINNQSTTTPMINEVYNYKIYDIESQYENIDGIDELINSGKYEQNPNDYKEMINLPNNDQISRTSNNRISDLSNAPLPIDVDLPNEKEILYNYSTL